MLEAKVKKLTSTALLPQRAHPQDIGCDVFADSVSIQGNVVTYGTGIAVTPPEGYYFELAPRSSISKYSLVLANSIGQIDPGYTGELKMAFVITSQVAPKLYNKGDKIGQLILRKSEYIIFNEVDSLDETDRADGGFGSTGE